LTEAMPRRRRLFERKEITRHGKTVWYFRRPGQARVRLPDDYGSPEYVEAYERALVGQSVERPSKAEKGTLSWLIDRYKASGHYASLSESSKTHRDYILRKVAKESGHHQFAKIGRKHMQEAMDRRAKTPHAANNFLVAMSVLFRWAVKNDMIANNPCDEVERRKDKIVGHKAWAIDNVETFRAAYAIGTKERLALDLLLFTGLRRADVVRIGRQHVRGGSIVVKTGKTGATVYLPIFAELRTSIDAATTGDLVFLTNKRGEAFNDAAFGMWFIRKCRNAGLHGYSAHGLRKAGATIAASNGATAHELMAMFGWSRLSMAEVYTRQADRERLARGASERIANNSRPHLEESPGSSVEKGTKISS
jgi:site-specific recombinase XerD